MSTETEELSFPIAKFEEANRRMVGKIVESLEFSTKDKRVTIRIREPREIDGEMEFVPVNRIFYGSAMSKKTRFGLQPGAPKMHIPKGEWNTGPEGMSYLTYTDKKGLTHEYLWIQYVLMRGTPPPTA